MTFPAIAADGNYNIGFYCHSQAPDGYILYVTDVELTAVTNGVLKGTVTDGTNPIGNAVVYIESLKISSITEADGSFDFGEIEAGEYDILIEADGSMNKDLYRPLYEAGADMVVLGPPALWNKDADFEKAWSIMENELEQELDGAERKI